MSCRFSKSDASNLEINFDADMFKKMTTSSMIYISESIQVPSSDHVSEIVGKKGCKIKSLRYTTNTYIRTPGKNECPVFVVSGLPENVSTAIKFIKSEVDHFSSIRQQRKIRTDIRCRLEKESFLGSNLDNYCSSFLKVPYSVVGLIVGSKGATIKTIQERAKCYIITPNRSKNSVFEIFGTEQNITIAKKIIFEHLQLNLSDSEKITMNSWFSESSLDSEQVAESVDSNRTNYSITDEIAPQIEESDTFVNSIKCILDTNRCDSKETERDLQIPAAYDKEFFYSFVHELGIL
ncbi:MAG: K y RNA-binding domain [Paramarteilia canceri]